MIVNVDRSMFILKPDHTHTHTSSDMKHADWRWQVQSCSCNTDCNDGITKEIV